MVKKELQEITWAQRKEMMRSIDAYGGMMKVHTNQTLPIDFIELALKYGYGLTEEVISELPYQELVEGAMAVFEAVFLKVEQEKKS